MWCPWHGVGLRLWGPGRGFSGCVGPRVSRLVVAVSGGRSLGEAFPSEVFLVWLVLASGPWLTGAGIGRISWSLGLASMMPTSLSMCFRKSEIARQFELMNENIVFASGMESAATCVGCNVRLCAHYIPMHVKGKHRHGHDSDTRHTTTSLHAHMQTYKHTNTQVHTCAHIHTYTQILTLFPVDSVCYDVSLTSRRSPAGLGS